MNSECQAEKNGHAERSRSISLGVVNQSIELLLHARCFDSAQHDRSIGLAVI
jgi:hypothetical protein